MYVSGELNRGISGALLLRRLHIARCLRMISACDHQLGIGKCLNDSLKRINHQFKALVGPPLAEGEYAVLGIAATGEIRIFGSARQNAMRSDVHIVAAIFFGKNAAIARHEDGHRIGQQQHSGRDCACRAIQSRVPYPGILQIHSVHQVVQRHMRVASAQPGKKRGEKPHESIQWVAAKCAEQKIEPHDVRFQLSQGKQEAKRICRVVKRPATLYVKALEFRLRRRHLIGKNCQTDERIAAQLLGNMQSILAQPTLTGWESGDQTDFHSYLALASQIR
jgi:hypothetical protein